MFFLEQIAQKNQLCALKSFSNSIKITYFALQNRKKTFINNKIFTTMSEIASRVKAIIADKLNVDENEVTENAEFTKDLGADSLDTVELIMEFEKEFGITIPDDKAEGITTVKDAIDYIEAAKN